MIGATLLTAYALLLAIIAPPLLRRHNWTARAPRLGIAAWQAASVSFVSALVLAGLVLAMPSARLAGGLSNLVRSCAMAIATAYHTPGGAAAVGTGLVLTATVSGRVAWCVTRAALGTARCRRRHAATLRLVGRLAPALGATVIDTATAGAYCLPGRARQVVLTSGAIATLSTDELSAVLAHERAHLAGRHHLLLAGADALTAALPQVPLLAQARSEIARLTEMLADDAATARHERATVAAALVTLAAASNPPAALAAGGPTALARVRRLLAPAPPLGTIRSAAGVALVAALLAVPVVVAAAPAAAVAGMTYCAVPMSGPGAHNR